MLSYSYQRNSGDTQIPLVYRQRIPRNEEESALDEFRGRAIWALLPGCPDTSVVVYLFIMILGSWSRASRDPFNCRWI